MTTASAPAASTADMIHAIRAVQVEQATKIGTACIALATAKTPIDQVALATELQILAGLDLAVSALQATV